MAANGEAMRFVTEPLQVVEDRAFFFQPKRRASRNDKPLAPRIAVHAFRHADNVDAVFEAKLGQRTHKACST